MANYVHVWYMIEYNSATHQIHLVLLMGHLICSVEQYLSLEIQYLIILELFNNIAPEELEAI